jgi:hypothetical protein
VHGNTALREKKSTDREREAGRRGGGGQRKKMKFMKLGSKPDALQSYGADVQ